MTKKELIESLNDYEDDRPVLICCGTNNREIIDVTPDIETNDPVLSC